MKNFSVNECEEKGVRTLLRLVSLVSCVISDLNAFPKVCFLFFIYNGPCSLEFSNRQIIEEIIYTVSKVASSTKLIPPLKLISLRANKR